MSCFLKFTCGSSCMASHMATPGCQKELWNCVTTWFLLKKQGPITKTGREGILTWYSPTARTISIGDGRRPPDLEQLLPAAMSTVPATTRGPGRMVRGSQNPGTWEPGRLVAPFPHQQDSPPSSAETQYSHLVLLGAAEFSSTALVCLAEDIGKSWQLYPHGAPVGGWGGSCGP